MTAGRLILGRYRLEREIAVGGTARVWRAHDGQLDRPVAVKLLHPHLLPDESSRRRLAAEATAAAALDHPGIAAVHDVSGPDDAQPALVMELVDGEPLSTLLAREGPIRPATAARLTAEVADALFHAHQRGIVHRDVKPANVMVQAGDGRARLIDFGIAHSLEAAAESLTRTGTALGTPLYMAPEQLAGDEPGPRTDLWGLGALLHEMLSGRPPFAGGGPLAIARAHLAGPPPLPDIDPALEAVARACLAVDIADRPLHAGRVAEALRAWLAGDAAPALALSPPTAPTASMPAVPRADAGAGERQHHVAPGQRQPNRVLIAAAAAVLVTSIVAGAVAWTSGQDGLAASASTTASPTARPTPDWQAALLADYRAACDGGELRRSDLRAFDQDRAARLVAGLVDACRLADAVKPKPKPKKGGHGGGHGHGHDHGPGGKKR